MKPKPEKNFLPVLLPVLRENRRSRAAVRFKRMAITATRLRHRSLAQMTPSERLARPLTRPFAGRHARSGAALSREGRGLNCVPPGVRPLQVANCSKIPRCRAAVALSPRVGVPKKRNRVFWGAPGRGWRAQGEPGEGALSSTCREAVPRAGQIFFFPVIFPVLRENPQSGFPPWCAAFCRAIETVPDGWQRRLI